MSGPQTTKVIEAVRRRIAGRSLGRGEKLPLSDSSPGHWAYLHQPSQMRMTDWWRME